MKRLPGEDFEAYRLRRKGEGLIARGHLKGRLPSGQYVDPALHLTMEKTVRKGAIKTWVARIGLGLSVGFVAWLIWYAII